MKVGAERAVDCAGVCVVAVGKAVEEARRVRAVTGRSVAVGKAVEVGAEWAVNCAGVCVVTIGKAVRAGHAWAVTKRAAVAVEAV